MRESLIRAIEALADLDAETVRQLSEAFVDYFDARHADLRLLDLEYRLGLASEETLLNAYRGVAYLNAAALFRGVALTTMLARLGVGVTRLRPREAIVALRSAALRFDGMIVMQSATVDTFVARRFAELAVQGAWLPTSRRRGDTPDACRPGSAWRRSDDRDAGGWCYRPPAYCGPFRDQNHSEADYVAAEVFIRRSPDYNHAREEAISRIGQRPTTRFEVAMPLDEVLGSDFANSVEGVSRLVSVRNPTGVQSADFSGGRLVAVFELNPDGQPLLVTMFPTGVRQ